MKLRSVLILTLTAFAAYAQKTAGPPVTERHVVTDEVQGVRLEDPYRWLEEQQSPQTRAWIDAQIAYTRTYLDGLPGREKLRKRLEELARIDVVSAPVVRNGKYFYTRRLARENRASILMRDGFAGPETVLVDPVHVSSDETTSVGMIDIASDGSVLVYSVRQGGEDEFVARLLDVRQRELMADTLPRGRYFGFDLEPDKKGFFYAKFDVKVGTRVYHHKMGTPAADDKLIFGEGYGPEKNIGTQLSEDGRYLTVTVVEGVPPTNFEIYVRDLRKEGSALQPIVRGLPGEFAATVCGDVMFVRTNWKAPNWRILRVDLKNPAQENWKEIIPESTATMDSATYSGGRIFAGYLENVQSRIRQFDADGRPLGDVRLPGVGTASPPVGQWSADEAYFVFSSFVQPGISYRYQVSTGKQDVWFRPKMPVDTDSIEVRQVWYESKDKTRIPMFVVHKKGLKLDGNRPVYLTGYGGFNIAMTPKFSPVAAVVAEWDGVYALANLRGGGEFGEKWHEAGMFERKQNVFDDFIAAAEYLIENGYTKARRIAIQGGSNGGLLVGAAVTQRPDLFGAVLCGAPLLDMIRFHKAGVGKWWVTEYGSADDPKQFEYIRKYSPYQNVKKGVKYPAVMFTTGDADTRVDPMHARKMAALMQASTGSKKPILLRYDTKVGHVGALPVSKQVELTADMLSFAFHELGVL